MDATVEYDGTRVLVDGYAPDRDPIAQAKAAASHVRGILEAATRAKPPVRAAVVFPGWWVVSPPRVEVWVLNPTRLLGYIRHEPIRLADAQVNQLAAALATHVRAKQNAV